MASFPQGFSKNRLGFLGDSLASRENLMDLKEDASLQLQVSKLYLGQKMLAFWKYLLSFHGQPLSFFALS